MACYFTVVEGGFACVLDLVKYIRCSPTPHPKAGLWGQHPRVLDLVKYIWCARCAVAL